MNLNFGDLVILFMIGAGFAGLLGYTVYEYLETRNDRKAEKKNGTTDYWDDVQ